MKTPIDIEIPKSLPQHPWHPSVVYVPEGWNGHRYWMAQTPYPPFHIAPYRDRWEVPCIHYSDDGLQWKSIEGNPIEDLTEEQIASHSYHSDTHLVMNDGVLYCYYRLMEDHDARTTILRKKSRDGVKWSEREEVKVESRELRVKREIISPAVVWTGEKWRMYYVDDTYTNLNRGIQMAESEDGVLFEAIGPVWKQQEVKPWHIDVQLISKVYYLLVHDVDNNALWLYSSSDGLHFDNGKHILHASHKLSDFWSYKLYRACVVKENENKHIYFSANDGMASYIGLIEENELGMFTIVDCMHGARKAIFVICFWGRRIMQFVQRVVRFIKRRIK